MVEKEGFNDDESTAVMVDAVSPRHRTNSVGAAIEILEGKLAEQGFIFQFPPNTKEFGKDGTVEGKLLRLPNLIQFAITHAIDNIAKATVDSVGKVIKSHQGVKTALVPGNVVALHCSSKDAFARIMDTSFDYGGGARDSSQLPFCYDSERFLVVPAGSDLIALYSPSHRRFLGFLNGSFTASGFPITSADEPPRANEMFRATLCQHAGCFELNCPMEQRTPKKKLKLFQCVQVYGFE